jgi:hypothetical protein
MSACWCGASVALIHLRFRLPQVQCAVPDTAFPAGLLARRGLSWAFHG